MGSTLGFLPAFKPKENSGKRDKGLLDLLPTVFLVLTQVPFICPCYSEMPTVGDS